MGVTPSADTNCTEDNLFAPLDDNRAADFVIVPDIAGLPFLEAREIAYAAGVSIANPNRDGPPIRAIVWPENPTIQRQDPESGTVAYRWDSRRVWLRSDPEPDMARTLDTPPPSADRARATPAAPISFTDLTGGASAD